MNLLSDPENRKYIAGHYMTDMTRSIYTDAHKHTNKVQRKQGQAETIFRMLRVWLVL